VKADENDEQLSLVWGVSGCNYQYEQSIHNKIKNKIIVAYQAYLLKNFDLIL
jgi:hypothetical protein